jgi:CO dehydrogenase/acetyl-CoA synthase beta subunit
MAIKHVPGVDVTGRPMKIGDIIYDPNYRRTLYIVCGESKATIRAFWIGCNSNMLRNIDSVKKLNQKACMIHKNSAPRCTIIPFEMVDSQKKAEAQEILDKIREIYEQDDI